MPIEAPECPCADAHRRLMDFHEDIHRAIENYFDPNEFRRWLNSAIQNSRGVTFLLQKRKEQWSDFDQWYGAWRTMASRNKVLTWGVSSRNRIVKEEDLTTYSEAKISLYGERRLIEENVFRVPPHVTVDMILRSIAAATAGKRAQRTLVVHIQRRWIEQDLPEYELVAALREAYRVIAEVVSRAHEASDVAVCAVDPFARACVGHTIDPMLECLPPGDALPSRVFDLASGKGSSYGYTTLESDSEVVEEGKRRYGSQFTEFTRDPIEHAAERLKMSKRFLEVDGYAGPVLVLFNGGDVRILGLMLHDDEPRELTVAATIQSVGAWPFQGAMYASEMWLTTPEGRGSLLGQAPGKLLAPDDEFFTADPIGGRDEALVVIALAADGRSRSLVQPFGRTTSGVVYGTLIDDDSGSWIPPFLNPIWRNWPPSARRAFDERQSH
tara:strand:- start:1993 stop:3312 length:1320 start_codon:yes stop_codon:yes gene_type:complete